MARRPKAPSAYGRGYICAEDLCDPFDDAADPGDRDPEATRRTRNRAERLVDSLGEPEVGKKIPKDQPSRKSFPMEPSPTKPLSVKPSTTRPPSEKPYSADSAGKATLPDLSSKKVSRHAAPEMRFSQKCNTPAILSINPVGEGEMVSVLLVLPGEGIPGEGIPSDRISGDRIPCDANSADGFPAGGAGEMATQCAVYLLVEQYTRLNLRAGGISPELAADIQEAGKLCAAIRRGIRLLSYGDTSARRLAYKLTARGVDGDTAREAVAYLTRRGYIREDNAARRRAEQGVSKLWGPRRIREDLRAGGFTPDAIEDAMEDLSEVDFEENCRLALAKKRPPATLDRPTYQKLTAYLLRLGYGSDTVRRVLREWEE